MIHSSRPFYAYRNRNAILMPFLKVQERFCLQFSGCQECKWTFHSMLLWSIQIQCRAVFVSSICLTIFWEVSGDDYVIASNIDYLCFWIICHTFLHPVGVDQSVVWPTWQARQAIFLHLWQWGKHFATFFALDFFTDICRSGLQASTKSSHVHSTETVGISYHQSRPNARNLSFLVCCTKVLAEYKFTHHRSSIDWWGISHSKSIAPLLLYANAEFSLLAPG